MSGVNALRGKRVYAGLSGGVDSAVTAALLRDAGALVTGVFIKGWYPDGMPCTWREDRADAMRAAAHLGLAFQTLDAGDAYKRGVIDYLLAEYRAGRTPNPDVMCNRDVKFGAFYRFAREQGADWIATGHYARTTHCQEGTQLLRGTDPSKDQSYFLWAVPGEALERTLFPLGSMQKRDVRALASRYGLPQADKPDSQGICFLGDVSVEDFLRHEFGEEQGVAEDLSGKAVGTHGGALLHTIGARIALSSADPGPWYVIAKDLARNVLTVARDRAAPRETTAIALQSVNLLDAIEASESLTAQYRYHGPTVLGRFDTATSAFTPAEPIPEPLAAGQSLVLYRAERLIGGGIMA
jgi:tRNA-uridine 2-sulfurtransferase